MAQAIRPASRNLSVSQGKGLTMAAAKVSAAMESVELWHAENLDHVPQMAASWRRVARENSFDISALPWRCAPNGLDEAEIPWVRASSLHENCPGWLPRGLVELDFTLHGRSRLPIFFASSSGLASGNTPAEAQLHGVCELIERHALFRVQGRSLDQRAICLESLENERSSALVRRFHEAGMKLAVFDISWSGIPVIAAIAAAPDLPGVWKGSGCHPSPEVAFSRAVTEAAQARSTFISGARDDLPEPTGVVCAAKSFDSFEEPAGVRQLSNLPDLSTPTLAGDLEKIANRLANLDCPVFYIDLSHRTGPWRFSGISVVKTWAPGLRTVFHV